MAFNFIDRTRQAAKAFTSYEATESSPHRKSPARTIKRNDDELSQSKRKKGVATVREETTNNSLLKWIIRKHLDYVSRFNIHFRSGNAELDEVMQRLLDWHSRPNNFDIAKRHGRNRWLRLFEASKVVQGDAFGLKLNGGKLQGLNADQISKPQSWDADNSPPMDKLYETTQHGLILGQQNQAREYCVCYRNEHGKLVFERFVNAQNVIHKGYFDEFNQTRGTSPLLAAINDAIDLKDIKLYSKVNLKLKNLFGIALFRDTDLSIGDREDEDEPIKFSPDQINILDLDANDKVDTMETNQPGPDSQAFMKALSQSVMLALDIPYTSLDSSHASFSARIGDRAEYEESAEIKREDNAEVLREIYAWLVPQWMANIDELRQAADNAGMDAGQIVRMLDIIPAGSPWMDKLNEVKGDILALQTGQESIPRLARKRGLDAYQIVREQAEFLKYAQEQGVPLLYADGGQDAVQKIMDADTNRNDGGQSNGNE